MKMKGRKLDLITRGPTSRNTSGYKGVSFHRQIQKWKAEIKLPNGTKPSLGCYPTPEEAALVYDQAAFGIYGEMAYLNFPDKLHGGSD